MTSETRESVQAARAAVATAVAAVEAARALWESELSTNPSMHGAFPLAGYFPTEQPAANAHLAEVDKALSRN